MCLGIEQKLKVRGVGALSEMKLSAAAFCHRESRGSTGPWYESWYETYFLIAGAA